MLRPSLPIIGVLLAGMASITAASAQTKSEQLAGSPDVTVTIGQALSLKAGDYGAQALDELTNDLASTVGRALARGKGVGTLTSVHLVLEDATPSRPTIAQLGHTPGLSERSVGLGGAWVDGYVEMADNKHQPISFSYYQNDLREEPAPVMWYGADRAFDFLARDLARGNYPQETQSGRAALASFAHWPR